MSGVEVISQIRSGLTFPREVKIARSSRALLLPLVVRIL